MELSDLQKQMLQAGEFHLDGWCSQRGHEAAADLVDKGLLTRFDSVSPQYTALNYTITDAGREALASQE